MIRSHHYVIGMIFHKTILIYDNRAQKPVNLKQFSKLTISLDRSRTKQLYVVYTVADCISLERWLQKFSVEKLIFA